MPFRGNEIIESSLEGTSLRKGLKKNVRRVVRDKGD